MKIPFIVTFMYIILPILIMGTTFVMMKIIPRVGDD